MKLFYKTFIIFFVITATFIFANEWVSTGNIRPASPEWEVNSISDSNIEINFSLGGYYINEVENIGKYISFPGSVPILEKGSPELPRMARSIIIPDLANMELEILDSKFIEFPIDNIVPSKGNLTRDINPEEIPYTYC